MTVQKEAPRAEVEYLVVSLNDGGWKGGDGRSSTIKYRSHTDSLVAHAAVLNDLGREGWEMAGVSDRGDDVYFKRPRA